jgi:hypothetical protein
MKGMASTLSRNGPRKQNPIELGPFTEVISLRETFGTAH